MLSHGLWCVLGAAARSVARPSSSGSGFAMGPWDIFDDGGSAARLVMLRAPSNLEVALLMCSRFMCCDVGDGVYFIMVKAGGTGHSTAPTMQGG